MDVLHPVPVSVVINAVSPSEVQFMHATGTARVPLANLPAEWQQKFAFDPNEEKEMKRREAEAEAAKTAVAAMRKKLVDNTVTVSLPGGPLVVEWRDDDHVMMTGPVESEFDGEIDPETFTWRAAAKGAA